MSVLRMANLRRTKQGKAAIPPSPTRFRSASASPSTTYLFLDGDEFLWSGTQTLYPIVFAKLYLAIKRGLPPAAAAVAKCLSDHDPEFKEGLDFYFSRVGKTEIESYYLMIDRLQLRSSRANCSLTDFIQAFKTLFRRDYTEHYRLMLGAKPLLDSLSSLKKLRVYVLSNNTDYSVKKITHHLGISEFFVQVIGAPFNSRHSGIRYSKAAEIVRIARHTPAASRRVFMGGDSETDVEAALKATQMGVETRAFGAASNARIRKQLIEKKAGLVVPDLTHLDEILTFIKS